VVRLRDDFAVGIVTARGADVMRALELAAVRAFVRVRGGQAVMRAAHVAAGPGNSVLRDGHGTTFGGKMDGANPQIPAVSCFGSNRANTAQTGKPQGPRKNAVDRRRGAGTVQLPLSSSSLRSSAASPAKGRRVSPASSPA